SQPNPKVLSSRLARNAAKWRYLSLARKPPPTPQCRPMKIIQVATQPQGLKQPPGEECGEVAISISCSQATTHPSMPSDEDHSGRNPTPRA
ncbi:hypothetical protein As57867_014519, partial [Aphanomyces stellatus]